MPQVEDAGPLSNLVPSSLTARAASALNHGGGYAVRWRALLVSSAYSCATWLMMLQIEALRERLGVPSSGERLTVFVAATALMYVGMLLGIVAQGAVMPRLDSRQRVVVALALLGAVHVALLVLFYSAKEPLCTNIGIVAVGYLVVGASRMVAETNAITIFAEHGPEAQRFVTLGMTSGWTGAGVVFFSLVALYPGSVVLAACFHTCIAMLCVAGASVMYLLPPPFHTVADTHHAGSDGSGTVTVARSLSDLRVWHHWLPTMRFEIATASLLGAVSGLVIALVQLLYLKATEQTLFPGATLPKGAYMAVFCVLEFLGGTVGPLVAHRIRYPKATATVCAAIAVACVVSRIPALALMSGFFAWVAYSLAALTASVTITLTVEPRYTLTAVSVWALLEKASLLMMQLAAGPWSAIVGPVGDV